MALGTVIALRSLLQTSVADDRRVFRLWNAECLDGSLVSHAIAQTIRRIESISRSIRASGPNSSQHRTLVND